MKKVFLNYLLPILLLCFGYSLSAQTEMSLEQAIEYARKHSLTIQNAQINIADAEAVVEERKAFGLPQLNGKIDYSYYFKVPKLQLPGAFVDLARDSMGELPPDYDPNVSFSLKHNLNFGLSFSSILFDGSYLSGLKAARRFRDYVSIDLIAKEKEVVDKVREAYLPSLLIAESLVTLDKNLANLEKLFTETQALYEEGFIEQLDVDRLELSIANLKTEKDKLTRQRKSAIDYLKFAISYPIGEELVPTDDISSLLVEATDAELTGDVNYGSWPQYRVAEMGLLLNELNIDVFRKGYLPSVSVFASYQYGFQGNKFDDAGFWVPTGLVGGQINIPIFDGFDKRAKIQRAKLALDVARNQKKDLERAIDIDVQNSRTNYNNALLQVASQRKNMELAERIYNTTMIKYREGVGSSLEISQGEQSLYTTQQNYTQALYDLLVAKAALDKALGN